MINYRRREKQANENSKIIIDRLQEKIIHGKTLYEGKYVIRNEKDLLNLVKEISEEVRNKANCIQPDWGIPIIMESIAKLYYGEQKSKVEYGTTFKRALVYLWNANFQNSADKKNLDSLLEILKMCYALEVLYGLRRLFLFCEEFRFEVEDGYCNYDIKFKSEINKFAQAIQGRGKRLRIAEVNSKLMNERSKEFIEALTSVLDGKNPKDIELFKGTFYEFIPGVVDNECKKFWQNIFFRYMLYGMVATENVLNHQGDGEFEPTVTVLHEFGMELQEEYFTQEIVQNTFWNQEWINRQDEENYGNLIVERPILRISKSGDFATSLVLIGDSINSYIESQIFNYTTVFPKINLPQNVFKKAISEPFEEKVIRSLKRFGFVAGHITENGVWMTGECPINLKWNEKKKLYGEVDAMAYNETLNFALIIECKVLNDVRDYRSCKNLIAKLIDDSEGFHTKLIKKGEWVNEALSIHFHKEVMAVRILLTDLPLPLKELSNKDIIITDYECFIQGMEQLLENVDEILEKYLN